MIRTLSTPRKEKKSALHLSQSLGLRNPNLPDHGGSPQRSPQRSPRRLKKPSGDRFIPTRVRPGSSSYDSQVYSDEKLGLAAACGVASTRVLEFQRAQPQWSNPLEMCRPYMNSNPQVFHRDISHTPERVLDAPGLKDDFYLNLISWSRKNQLAIALDKAVYLWDGNTMEASHLTQIDEGYISSVQFNKSHYLGVGSSDGSIMIFDSYTGQKLRTMRRHIVRQGANAITSLAWSSNIITSGSEGGQIWHHDLRVAEHNAMELNGHTDAVCGLTYRGEGSTLASGSRDQTVKLWDCRIPTPKFNLTAHKSAVKALAWCPRQDNLLATGGGAHDRQIHFWNTTTGNRMHSVDSESQVSSIHWSPDCRELVSCHGLPKSSTIIWSYPTLSKVGTIEDNGGRILGSTLAPDGQTLATAADENLKFWKVFENTSKPTTSKKFINSVGLR